VDVGRGFLAPGNIEVAATRRAAADEDRLVRWTAACLLSELAGSDPALAALRGDPDPLIAARARPLDRPPRRSCNELPEFPAAESRAMCRTSSEGE